MDTKKCCRCCKIKSVKNFNYNTKTGKYYTRCTICSEKNNKESKEYYNKNKYKKQTYYKTLSAETIKKRKEYAKEYYKKNKDKILERQKRYKELHPEVKKRDLIKAKERIKKNPQKQKKYRLEYYKNNSKKIIKRGTDFTAKKIKNNVEFKLQHSLRSRLRAAIKNKCKTGSAVRDLGCSVSEFKVYISNKFQDGMTWDNWGLKGWTLDHIIPLSKFDLTDREQLLKACHYTNMQPLWAIDNIEKGNKILPEHVEKAKELGIEI